jgi:hypothetical protein
MVRQVWHAAATAEIGRRRDRVPVAATGCQDAPNAHDSEHSAAVVVHGIGG